MKHENDLVAAVGGLDWPVRFKDKSEKLVRVHILDVDDAQVYLMLLQANDEGGMIDLFCRQESGWFKKLTQKSQQDILEKGEEMNSDFMIGCVNRAKARREKLQPGFEEKALKMMAEQFSTLLQKSPPKAGTTSAALPSAASDKSEPSRAKSGDERQTTR